MFDWNLEEIERQFALYTPQGIGPTLEYRNYKTKVLPKPPQSHKPKPETYHRLYGVSPQFPWSLRHNPKVSSHYFHFPHSIRYATE